MLKRIGIFTIVLALMLTLSGCGGAGPAADTGSSFKQAVWDKLMDITGISLIQKELGKLQPGSQADLDTEAGNKGTVDLSNGASNEAAEGKVPEASVSDETIHSDSGGQASSGSGDGSGPGVSVSKSEGTLDGVWVDKDNIVTAFFKPDGTCYIVGVYHGTIENNGGIVEVKLNGITVNSHWSDAIAGTYEISRKTIKITDTRKQVESVQLAFEHAEDLTVDNENYGVTYKFKIDWDTNAITDTTNNIVLLPNTKYPVVDE